MRLVNWWMMILLSRKSDETDLSTNWTLHSLVYADQAKVLPDKTVLLDKSFAPDKTLSLDKSFAVDKNVLLDKSFAPDKTFSQGNCFAVVIIFYLGESFTE